MDTLIHADIFFFITSIVVIVLGVLTVIGFIWLLRILDDIKYISARLRQESDLVAGDIADLRTHVRKEGFKLQHFFSFFNQLRKRGRKK